MFVPTVRLSMLILGSPSASVHHDETPRGVALTLERSHPPALDLSVFVQDVPGPLSSPGSTVKDLWDLRGHAVLPSTWFIVLADIKQLGLVHLKPPPWFSGFPALPPPHSALSYTYTGFLRLLEGSQEVVGG